MVAALSWVAPGQPRHICRVAAICSDLANGWNAVEGGLLGYGACSQAQLTSAEVVTQVAASTCAGDTTATGPTCRAAYAPARRERLRRVRSAPSRRIT